jgi:hypothetical protein
MIRIGVRSFVAGGGAAPYVGLLDTYTDAAVAYSVRLLRSAYTGSAIRVRRSSDNTEQDIGFTALGNLDESALTTFVGANNGFVTTWYDQSGNGRNATQSTADNQPQIVASGVINKVNTKPSLLFDGTNDALSATAFSASLTNFTQFLALKGTNTTTTGQVPVSRFTVQDPPNNRSFLMRMNISSNRIDVNVSASANLPNDYWTNTNVHTTNTTLYTYTYNGALTASTIQGLRKNGAVETLSLRAGNNLVTAMTNNSEALRISGIGSASGPILLWIGNFSEYIYYPNSSVSISGVEGNINNYYGIY